MVGHLAEEISEQHTEGQPGANSKTWDVRDKGIVKKKKSELGDLEIS